MPSDMSSGGSERSSAVNLYVGDVIGNEYKLTRFINAGGSSEVWQVKKESDGKGAAVKVMYSVGKSVRALRAKFLSGLLGGLASLDVGLFSLASGMTVHERHAVVVYELLGMDLRSLLDKSDMFPVPSFQLREMLWQIGRGVAFLHGMRIVHTDIKPENVVLVDDSTVSVRDIRGDGTVYDKRILKDCRIKIIDLDESVTNPKHQHYLPGTVGYHPPEVYSRSGWSFPVDVFAIGCLTFEIFTGSPLLPWADGVRDYLYCVEKIIGKFQATQAEDICLENPNIFRDETKSPKVRTRGMDSETKDRLDIHIQSTLRYRKAMIEADVKEFIGLCVMTNPRQRLSIELVMRHRIFTNFSSGRTD